MKIHVYDYEYAKWLSVSFLGMIKNNSPICTKMQVFTFSFLGPYAVLTKREQGCLFVFGDCHVFR